MESEQQEKRTKLIDTVRTAWPHIKAALDRGHTIKVVHERLLEDGFHISYRLLASYVKRMRSGASE
jgi:hypothetical protein